MIDLHYPSTTVVGKEIPKSKFYEHLQVNDKMRQHFVSEVQSIRWLYKIAPSTIQVGEGKLVHEIVVFLFELKSERCPDEVFHLIDSMMPRHILFVISYEGKGRIILNYKKQSANKDKKYDIIKSFTTEWIEENQLSLPLQGETLDQIYENMAGVVSGFHTTSREDTSKIIELQDKIKRALNEEEALQRKIKSEKQLSRQMEASHQARELRRQIEQWEKEIETIKKIDIL